MKPSRHAQTVASGYGMTTYHSFRLMLLQADIEHTVHIVMLTGAIQSLFYNAAWLFLNARVLLGGVLFPFSAAVTALLQPVGFPSLGSLLLQDLRVIQNLQTRKLTDHIESERGKANNQVSMGECTADRLLEKKHTVCVHSFIF